MTCLICTGTSPDHDAVRQELTLPHDSGAVEGNVNHIKMIKEVDIRARAKFDLLSNTSSLATKEPT
jgi:hypothetical protein